MTARNYPKARRLDVAVPPGLQAMLDRNAKECRYCGRAIALINCRLEMGEVRTQLIDPLPFKGGWVHLPTDGSHLDGGLGVVRRFPPFPTDTLPYRRHSCREGQKARKERK